MKTAAQRSDVPAALAYHEAGHAAVAVAVGAWTPLLIVVSRRRGRVECSQGDVGNPRRRRPEALALLAGPVAEYLLRASGRRFHPVAFETTRSIVAEPENREHDLTRAAALYGSATWDDLPLFRRERLLTDTAKVLLHPIVWDAVDELARTTIALGGASTECLRYWIEGRPELAMLAKQQPRF